MAHDVRVTPLERLDAIAVRHDGSTMTFIAPEVPESYRDAVAEHLSMSVRVAEGRCASAWLAVGQAVELATEPEAPRRARSWRLPMPSRPVIATALAALVIAPAGGFVTAAWQSTPEPQQEQRVVVSEDVPPLPARPATVPLPLPSAPVASVVPPLPPPPPPPAPAPEPSTPAPAQRVSVPEPAVAAAEPRLVEVAPSGVSLQPDTLPVVNEVVEVVESAPVVGDLVKVPDELAVPLPPLPRLLPAEGPLGLR